MTTDPRSEVNASLTERERIAARIAELERENDATPSWGAAVGARIEEIRALKRRLSVLDGKEKREAALLQHELIEGIEQALARAEAAESALSQSREALEAVCAAPSYPCPDRDAAFSKARAVLQDLK